MRRIRLAGQLAEPISHYVDQVEAGWFPYKSGLAKPDTLVEIDAVAFLARRDGGA